MMTNNSDQRLVISSIGISGDNEIRPVLAVAMDGSGATPTHSVELCMSGGKALRIPNTIHACTASRNSMWLREVPMVPIVRHESSQHRRLLLSSLAGWWFLAEARQGQDA